ncbi:MAG: peptidylprolyl isomerase [Planctomycetes bacterium]|nr:peptidylprolyl isomerase [Planctomycetota bacterium]
MKIFPSLRLGGRTWYRPMMVLGIMGLAGLTCFLGRNGFVSKAKAGPAKPPTARAAAPEASSDYSRRVVAYINGNIPITREELGEYLIAREGAEKLELLVNKRIIEMACKEKGIEVTAAEVDADLAESVKGMGINLKDFVDKVLQHYHKTLFEWKEDVIRPKLLMTKLCRDRVLVSEDDLKLAFEAHYGEKVECKIILFPKGEEAAAMQVHAKVRNDDAEFTRQASQQASPSLASRGGAVAPFGHNTTGNEELEKQAFALHPGEVSPVIGTPEGPVILKCVRHIPADTEKSLAKERASLEKEVYDKKVQQMIPVVFKELRDKAQPNLILKNYTTEEELLRDVRQSLSEGAPPAGKATPPHGN